MKIKKIALFIIALFCIGVASSLTNVSANEGETTRIGYQMFQNHLWVESTGLCVEGMHTYGSPTKTDLVVVGGSGHSNVALQGYYPNMTNHIPVDYHNDAEYSEKIRDSIKFNSGTEMELIYASGYLDQADSYNPRGMIVKQDFVNPSKDGENQLIPEWTVSTSDEVFALTLGEFDSTAGVEVAGVTMDGKVYVVTNPESSGSTYWSHTFSDMPRSRSTGEFTGPQVKTPIDAIDDLDGNNPSQQDIIVGFYENVTAISTNNSNRVIWDVTVDYFISDLVAVDDINSDGLQDIVVATRDGIYLLSGADGSILDSIIEASSYYRDVEVYNSTAIITGNDDGDVFVWDINTASPTFGDQVLSANYGNYDINDILIVEDLDEDGINEIALGCDFVVRVVYGDDLSSIWAMSPSGNWNGGAINVYDMALLEDLNGDGKGDLAVTGYSDHGAVFVYSTYGQLHFQPDLYGYGGSIDSICEEDSSHVFEFTVTAYQLKGLSVTVEISIDDGAYTAMTQGSGSWTTGVTFTYSQGGFSDGDHTYKFRLTDTFPDEVFILNQSFQVGGDCGGGDPPIDIPGAGIWMILSSIGIGLAISLFTIRKRLKR